MITFEWICVEKTIGFDAEGKPNVGLVFVPAITEGKQSVGCKFHIPLDCSRGFDVGKSYELSLGDPQVAACVPPAPAES